MARAMTPQIAMPVIKRHFTAWSFSRWKDYCTCPRYGAWKHLAKMHTADSPAMARGTAVHKGAEDFVLGKARKVAAELANVAPVLGELKALKRRVQVEANWGFTRQWDPCAWDDWNNCWLRVKMDVHWLDPKLPVLEMIDWKTGKQKPEEHKLQLKLYGVSGLKRFKDVEKAHGVLHYTDHKGTKEELTVLRREETKLMKYWEGEVKPMFNDRRYSPKPGPFCRYCDFSKSKGGACQF